MSGNIGEGCVLRSTHYGLTAHNIGPSVTINVRDAIKVKNIGSNSSLISTHYGLDANDVGDRVTIQVRDAINLNTLGAHCIVDSQHYGVTIAEDIADNSQVTARDDIQTGRLGNFVQLKSEHGKIRLCGNAGHHIKLNARDNVRAKDIGDHANVVSNHGEVNLNHVGERSTISARGDIDIEGYCPASVVTRSQHGKVRKARNATPPRPAHIPLPPTPVPAPVNQSFTFADQNLNEEAALQYAIALSNAELAHIPLPPTPVPAPVNQSFTFADQNLNEEAALQYAIALSNAELASKQGIFAKPLDEAGPSQPIAEISMDQKPSVDEIKIPQEYICPISEEIMKDPVMFIDGHTYDRAFIESWLNKKRTSPLTRVKMRDNLSVADSLITNYALKSLIDTFLKTHPEVLRKEEELTTPRPF